MYFTVSSDDQLAGGEGALGTAPDGEQGRAASEINGQKRSVANGDGGKVETEGQAPRGAVGEGVCAGEGRGRGSGGGESGRLGTDFDRVGGDGDGGGSGAARLTVISNDEMRNHRMALLEPVPFKR